MAFDGVLIHYLIKELNTTIKHKRIGKVLSLNEYEYVFVMGKTKLFISINPNNPHLRLSELDFINSNTYLTPFLKKHIEGGFIANICQYNNDRIIIIEIINNDDLGYQRQYQIILELTGKNTNIIITDNDYIILDAVKKTSLSDKRLIQVKAKYDFIESDKVNPFTYDKDFDNNIFEGVSKLLFSEITYRNMLSKVINQPIVPTIFKTKAKTYFYIFDLTFLEGERLIFDSISAMLEYYFVNTIHEVIHNNEQKRLSDYIHKELNKLRNKLTKQTIELQDAHEALGLEKIANVLTANIHLVKPRQEELTCIDFYDNQEITIKLNPKVKPNENINLYFNKFKKAKRTIVNLKETITNTKNDISYYECLDQQTNLSNINDLREILNEVGIKKVIKKNLKPNILALSDSLNNQIFVGKNNIQNDYLTHKLANSNDYFFHVVAYPGSHVIFRGQLNDDAIKLAATIAAYYSQAKGPVSVDYTQVKWVKKIKGMKGSFVRYTNQKSINVTPDYDYITNLTHPYK